MKTVREMFVSLTAMLINHLWASIIEICVEKWRTQSLKKIEIQMSRHEKRNRSEQGCISCGILVSGIRARGVSSEHMENMEMFSCSPT